MEFKTDYKDEIPEGGTPTYNLVDQDGKIVVENVKIERSNSNEQEGDLFGALQVNQIGEALNTAKQYLVLMAKLADTLPLFKSNADLTVLDEIKKILEEE